MSPSLIGKDAKIIQVDSNPALRADCEESLVRAIQGGLDSERPTFIEIMIPSGAELTPLVIPWLRDECIPAEERNRKSY